MIVFVGATFTNNLWGTYEKIIIKNIYEQIDKQFPNSRNLFINCTWFGPQFNNQQYDAARNLIEQNFDNLFLLATVDPVMINTQQIDDMINNFGHPKLFKLGNFDTEYHFNFFAPVLQKHFKTYIDSDLYLHDVKWLFINYNRKPRRHRVEFVRQLIERDLKKHGIVTLGKPNVIFDKDPTNNLFFTVDENIQDYVETGHWYNTSVPDEFGLPHDVLSLHNIHYWQNHFLHIIGATEFNVWDDIFVSETQFKPILGLRPFLINGNPRTYTWLQNNGFKHFNKYFPNIDFDDASQVHTSICKAIEQLTLMTTTEIKSMYEEMLPELHYNRDRFYEFANEQKNKIGKLFVNE